MRIETDSIGKQGVTDSAYYGIHTVRAIANFPVTKATVNPLLIKKMILVKLAAATANHQTGTLSETKYCAIFQACQEILVDYSKYASHFITPAIQGGAGTSTNMNVNEVIANRAGEILGATKGKYQLVHPNDDVNMAQSTNDVYPTAGHLALIDFSDKLLTNLSKLCITLSNLATKHHETVKMGRTQLEDAVPTTFGKTFHAYYSLLKRDTSRIEKARNALLSLPLGGTAIGTGLTATSNYASYAIKELSSLTDLPLTQALDLSDAVQNTDCYVQLSSAYKSLAISLSKICNDLRLLGSGPQAGLFELQLPKKQAGSSIMPGKVNPVIPEVVTQVAYQVIGHDTTISLASEAGQLELNAFEPVMFYDLFESASMLSGALDTLNENCLKDLVVNKKRCLDMVEQSAGIATAISPQIGYVAATKLVKKSLKSHKSIRFLLQNDVKLPKETVTELLSINNLVHPLATKPTLKSTKQQYIL
ncbi:aspartate ammonia-lyase [Ligilactobacillus sp. WILCCON 0076]|uniref:Aspartate ammonia-lyase n=1 Tax=Ligilactobacillus ubinensis TaxID=2876789 RepID=A0A9X2FK36_9LACO|nr:aspartate ammonia-lyase [Ligilactobacillus ubinensis]MCP0887149.1 aspartate ammonia-lyase [Ligilactobacillus ubinensis]